jgi:signal transduction histidine kinase/CheY-like chemotaxis protein
MFDRVSTMNESHVTSFTPDLHVSAKPAIAVLIGIGVLFGFAAGRPEYTSTMSPVAVLILSLAVVDLLIESWQPRLSAWSLIASLIVTILFIGNWLHQPALIALMVIPTALAAALIGLRASLLIAIGETVLVAWLWRAGHGSLDLAGASVSVLLIWSVLGTLWIMLRPVQDVLQWSWQYYKRAQVLLDEARTHRAELEEALADLAQANRQLALMNEKLSAARQVAEEAQKAKAAFVANVSHEFRTPLNMIIGLTDLLLETPDVYGPQLPPALYEDLEIVRRNCEHLSAMVNDVLDLSQMEAGRLALRRERVNLAEIVDRAIAVVRPLLDKKHLSLQVTLPPDLPEVYCDRTRIRQVIVNLLSNAARYTEQGGIRVQVKPEARNVIVSVGDTGSGIAPEDAQRIFEPFYQGQQVLRSSAGGSGLGLSISKQFVELHGGEMHLESTLGVGSTFYFRLPIGPLTDLEAGPGRWLVEDWVWHERTRRANLPKTPIRPCLMICDETGDLYPVFARYADDVDVAETHDLTQVVEEFQRGPTQALVLNVASPQKLQALVQQARQELPGLPILGCCLSARAEHALAAGAIGYLLKPVTRAQLQGALGTVGRPVRRVLVVDDDPDALQLFARMLYACDASLEIMLASTGIQGLEKLRAERPDLVLLDVILPDVDGWQVLAAKTQDDALRDVAVIMLTAQDPGDRPAASEVLMVAMGEGLSLSQLLRCSQVLPTLLRHPDRVSEPADLEPDREPG